MSPIEARVYTVVSRVLHVDLAAIKPGHNFSADLGAQSIQSVELVAAFEEEFGLEFDEEAALSVETVDGAVKFITQVCADNGVSA